VKTRKGQYMTKDEAEEHLSTMAAGMWADSTLKGRRGLVERWIQWCSTNETELDDQSAVLFCLAISTRTPNSQLQALKDMSGTFLRLGLPHDNLKTAIAMMNAQGCNIPMKQAAPMEKAHLIEYLSNDQRLTWQMVLAMKIAWKTASRWDEVAHLTRSHFIHLSPTEVIIDWFTLPKGRRPNPYVPSRYTVIVGDWTEDICRLASEMHPTWTLSTWTTSRLDMYWKTVQPMARFHYTAHSFKRGAWKHLLKAIADNKIEMPPHILSTLMKHKSPHDALSNQDIRYNGDSIDLARYLGTQRATRLL
jgi:hypothetical protein